jgi:uncharacterized protein (DUF58 family)
VIDTILQQVCYIPYRVRWCPQQQRLGYRPSRMRGEGLEFDQLRESQAGESVRHVNWTATARHGADTLWVNTYYEEKDLTVMLLVDLSASMDFGSARLSKKALAAEVCASLAYSAASYGDRIGLIGFASDTACYLPPRQSRHYQWAIPEAILHYDSTRAQASFQVLAMTLAHHIKRRALVFLLSDFLTDNADELFQALIGMRHRHDLIGLQVQDPLEVTFPPGHATMVTRDVETGETVAYHFSRRNRRHMRATAEARQAQLQQMFQQCNIPHLTITSQGDYGTDITHLFLTSRGRQNR